MKKLFTLFLILLFCINLSAYATQIDLSVLNDDDLNKQLEPIIALYNEAAKTNSIEEFYNVSVKGYKFKKSGDANKIKVYNDVFSAAAAEFSAQKYELSKDRKYLKRAYKWTKIAVDDKTSQVFSIKADIVLASMFLDTKEMLKAYEQYRAVDIKAANEFLPKFQYAYNSTLEYKKNRRSETKNKWIRGIGNTLTILGGGMQAYGQALERQEYYDAIRNSGPKNSNNVINVYSY